MEINTEQYNKYKESYDRYVLTVKHRFSIYNDTDIHLITELINILGLPTTNLNCGSCNGLIKAQEVVRQLKPIFENYESTH